MNKGYMNKIIKVVKNKINQEIQQIKYNKLKRNILYIEHSYIHSFYTHI